MSEKLKASYLHMEMLSQIVDLPYDSELGIRERKEQILEALGFSKGKNISIKREFQLPEDVSQTYDIQNYITESINSGRFFSLLFKDGRWESMGGAPVTYLMSPQDIEKRLVFDNKRLVSALAHDGTVVNIDHKILLQTYSRRRSISSEITGFTNIDTAKVVNLGGGFRLQVDDINYVGGEPQLEISGYFSFNDMGSRVLALSCEQDKLVPRYETKFTVKIDKSGNLIYPFNQSGGYIQLSNAEGVVVQVLGSLFEKDGDAISRLIRGLMSVRPSMSTHQLEGIFSIPSKSEISAEVIDFDGIESFDLEGGSLSLTPKERLVEGQLASTNFLVASPKDTLSFVSYRNKIDDVVHEVVSSQHLNDVMKEEVVKHSKVPYEIFSREFTGPVKLGRLLNLLKLDWQDTDSTHIKKFINGKHEIIRVSIEGYELGFWKNNSEMVDFDTNGLHVSELSRVLGQQIVPVHLHSLREGD